MALRIFGVILLVFPLWTGAVRYYIKEKTEKDSEARVGKNSALFLALAYVVLLAALVAAGGPLLEEAGKQLDRAIFFAWMFAMAVGAGSMEALVGVVDSDFDAHIIQMVFVVLWGLLIVLFGGITNLTLA